MLVRYLVIVDFLLNSILIALLQSKNFSSSLLCVINFLPGLHFLLLKKSNTIGKQLGVSLDAKRWLTCYKYTLNNGTKEMEMMFLTLCVFS